MKFILISIFISLNAYATNLTYSGYLFKLNNTIYISKNAEIKKDEKLIELDLYETKDLCFKNLNKFCQVVSIVYENEIKKFNQTFFKNVHVQKTSGNLIFKDVKTQNIPMH